MDPVLLKKLFYVLYARPASETDDDFFYDLRVTPEHQVYVWYQVVTTLIYRLQYPADCRIIMTIMERLIQIYP